MREQREPWLKLPDKKKPGGDGERRLDPRFRTHVVAIQGRSRLPAEPPPQPPSLDVGIPKTVSSEIGPPNMIVVLSEAQGNMSTDKWVCQTSCDEYL